MALKVPQHTGDEYPSVVFIDIKDDFKTLEAALNANLNGAIAQLIAAAGKVPMGDGAGNIGRDWLPAGIQKLSTALADDYPLQTWADTLDNGFYRVLLTLPQNGLPAGAWYITVQRSNIDTLVNQNRLLIAKSSDSQDFQHYECLNIANAWTTWKGLRIKPTAAISPTLLNGWLDFGANYPISYERDAYNRVTLNGLIKGGSDVADTVAFTLPAGYRPSKDMVFSLPASTGGVRVEISTAGTVTVAAFIGHNGDASIYVSFSGVSFAAGN